jgi:hypothetical protein
VTIKKGINKREVKKLEAAKMRFLKSLFCLTSWDRQRNPGMRNKSNRRYKTTIYQKSWLDHLERMDRSRLRKLAFRYRPWERGDAGRLRKIWKQQETLVYVHEEKGK